MTDNQRAAYDWAKSHPDYRSIAAVHARELAGLVDELTAELTKTKRRVISSAMAFPECKDAPVSAPYDISRWMDIGLEVDDIILPEPPKE